MSEHRHCKQPDREFGELICGYPLPCPWHTVTVDLRSVPPTITIPATNRKALRPEVLSVLKEVARSSMAKEMETDFDYNQYPSKRRRARRLFFAFTVGMIVWWITK